MASRVMAVGAADIVVGSTADGVEYGDAGSDAVE